MIEEYTEKQLASLQKERPKNETDRRFVLSSQELLRERMNALQEGVKELKKERPEVLSFCAYGSMVKGTAHEGSDYDGFLFIDSKALAEKRGVSEEELLDSVPEGEYFKGNTGKEYCETLGSRLKEKLKLENEHVDDIRSRPISEKVIDRELERFSVYEQARAKYETDLDQWFSKEPKKGGDDIDALIAYEKAMLEHRGKRPQSPEPVTSNLANMFHLDIGGGVKEYRTMLLDKLSGLGTKGEEVWSNIIQTTEMFENNMSTDETKHYPRTLAEAQNVYGRREAA